MKEKMLITGASRGLGKAIVDKFENLYDVITISKTGIGCNYALDLTKTNDLKKACDIECDVLINNAGIASDDPIESFLLNVNAVMELSQANHDRMIEGAIINISSISANFPVRIRSIPNNYIITKTALSKFTNLLIDVKKPNIKVCCIEPEFIDTDMISHLHSRIKRMALNPNDVANVIELILNLPPHISLSNAVLRYV